MGVVTQKGNEFDKLKMRHIEEITAKDRLLAGTLLESLTERVAKIGEYYSKILDASETTDEVLEAEIFKQGEIETEAKSLMKSIQKWITEHTSVVDITSLLGANHRDNVRLPRNDQSLLMVSIKIGKQSLICSNELCTSSNLYPKNNIFNISKVLCKKLNMFFLFCL